MESCIISGDFYGALQSFQIDRAGFFFVVSSVILSLLVLSHNILALLFFIFFYFVLSFLINPSKNKIEYFKKFNFNIVYWLRIIFSILVTCTFRK